MRGKFFEADELSNVLLTADEQQRRAQEKARELERQEKINEEALKVSSLDEKQMSP